MEFKKKGKSIHGYGASTKVIVLLQYFKIDNKIIDYISDRNPKKNNLYTPGSKIQIINESKSRNLRPDYYLVLPWHFKKEILSRERKIRLKGTKKGLAISTDCNGRYVYLDPLNGAKMAVAESARNVV